MIELNHIHKFYNAGSVNEMCLFDDFSLTIQDGDFVSIVGSNGSGKTSLLNIICGSIDVDAGQIVIGGEDITKKKDYLRHRNIGRVYQDPSKGTCANMTILENMALAVNKGRPYNLGMSVKKSRIDYYKELLAPLNLGLEDKLHTKVGALSGGQRQRIAIARALYHNPQVMVLDEATSALDNETETAIMDAINSLQGQVTLIIVAHRLSTVKKCDIIYEVSDRGLVERNREDVIK